MTPSERMKAFVSADRLNIHVMRPLSPDELKNIKGVSHWVNGNRRRMEPPIFRQERQNVVPRR